MTRWSGVPVAGAVLVVSLMGCGKDASVPGSSAVTSAPTSATTMSPIKCPEHGRATGSSKLDSMWLAIVQDAAAFSQGALVPEVNDCQRLIVHDARAGEQGRYGPLGMLFAADSLDRILASLDSAGLPLRAAAAIYLTDEEYSPLELQKGWNCLYLVPRRDQVEGRIIHSESAHQCKRPLAAMPQPGRALAVTTPPSPPAALPSVARWTDSFQGKEGAQHIWVRCGRRACDVHPMGGNLPVTVMPEAVRRRFEQVIPDRPARARVLGVHGWYDDQILAIPAAGGKVKVGSERAYLVPNPALDAMTDVRTFDEWVPVAYAYLPSTIPEYRDKLNFHEGVNTILLRRDPHPTGVTAALECNEPTATEMWYAKVVPEDSMRRAKYFCAPRWVHPDGMHFPGAARWRWLDDDETTWVRCPRGCCAVE